MSKAIKWITKGGLVGETVRSLKPKKPDEVTPEPAPDPDEYEAARAESRRLGRRKRTGRTSTVLTGGSQLG